MSFFSAIGKWFQSLWNTSAVQAFKNFAIQVFQAETPVILGQLSSIALGAVSQINAQNLTNTDARNAAFKAIGEQAKTQGIAAGDSDINLAIEMAVKALKNNSVGNQGVVTTS